jgi:hypothetical protein
MTVIKAGFLVTAKVGTGLVLARLPDGSWSAPSAIGTLGASFGAQIGGELTDYFILLNTPGTVPYPLRAAPTPTRARKRTHHPAYKCANTFARLPGILRRACIVQRLSKPSPVRGSWFWAPLWALP